MFDKTVKELSKSYNVEEYVVIDCLKSSIEEVLSLDYGYTVNAIVEDDIVKLIAEIKQQGVITNQELSLERIKSYHKANTHITI